MNWKDIEPGMYSAKIKDFGLEEVGSTGSIKAVIILDVEVYQETATQKLTGKWEGFIETKEGRPNLKTYKTLALCGMNSDDILDLAAKPDALDRSLELEVQVIRDEKGYARIEWINRPGGMGMTIKKAPLKKRPGLAHKAALAEARKAAGAKRSPSPNEYQNFDEANEIDEIPF